MRHLPVLIILVLAMLELAVGQTWISGEVVMTQAYQALAMEPEALQIRYRPSGTNVPDGSHSWRSEVLAGSESNTPRVKVRLEVNGTLIQSWIVGFVKRRTVLCYVTRSELPPGRLIDIDQLEVVEKYWDGKGSPVVDRETLLGRQVRRYLPPGTVLNKRDLVLRPVISRGERVEVKTNQNGLSVSFEGVAQRPGYPGQLLPVKTPTGAILEVWVDYQGKVRAVEED